MAVVASLFMTSEVSATRIEHRLSNQQKLYQQVSSEGIFSRMIDQVTAPERLAEERHEATQRKEQ
jgi:hypothetical protein